MLGAIPLGFISSSSGFDPTTIEQSTWFDGSADYLSRTYTSGSTWSFSVWVLRTGFGTLQNILGTKIQFNSSNQIVCNGLTSTPVYRDIGWYHIFCNSSGLWVNGESVSGTGTYSMTAITDAGLGGPTNFFNGYMAQACLADGSTLSATDFGTSAVVDNGSAWSAKTDNAVTAFANSAAGTSFCLTTVIGDGTDASTNANNFTPNSMSHATNGSASTPSKNYSILNPLQNSSATISNGGLSWSIGGADGFNTSTLGMPSGKWVCEFEETGGNTVLFGVVSDVAAQSVALAPTIVTGGAYFYGDSGNKSINGSTTAYGASFTTGNAIRAELDLDAMELEFFKDGTSQGTITLTESVDKWFFAGGSNSGSASFKIVFEADNFAGTPTSNFLELNTENLSDEEVPASPDTGSFTGNLNTNGPVVDLGYAPSADDALTINSNAVTWGTHAYRTFNGFKVISSSSSYNNSGSNTYSLVTTNAVAGNGTLAPIPGQYD
jgi:hypothetical protein